MRQVRRQRLVHPHARLEEQRLDLEDAVGAVRLGVEILGTTSATHTARDSSSIMASIGSDRRDPPSIAAVVAEALPMLPFGKIPWPEDARRRSVSARRGDDQLTIGSAEIRVFGEHGTIYAAPTLIYHYVLEHRYKPPEDFVRGLLEGPRPPSDEYRARLRLLGV